MALNPPNINGVMLLTEEEIEELRTKLQSIVSNFSPSDNHPSCDTFYIVSTYNINNPGAEINGDTADYILGGE